jgi:hypothetical protein
MATIREAVLNKFLDSGKDRYYSPGVDVDAARQHTAEAQAKLWMMHIGNMVRKKYEKPGEVFEEGSWDTAKRCVYLGPGENLVPRSGFPVRIDRNQVIDDPELLSIIKMLGRPAMPIKDPVQEVVHNDIVIAPVAESHDSKSAEETVDFNGIQVPKSSVHKPQPKVVKRGPGRPKGSKKSKPTKG